MSDILERLRSWQCASTRLKADFDDAADEIERLRAERDDAVRRMEAGWIEVCENVHGAALVSFTRQLDEARRLLTEARKRAEWYSSRSTHWEGCELIHPDCAVLKQIDAFLKP